MCVEGFERTRWGEIGKGGSRRRVDLPKVRHSVRVQESEGGARSLLGKSATRKERGGHEAGTRHEDKETTGKSFLRNENTGERKGVRRRNEDARVTRR